MTVAKNCVQREVVLFFRSSHNVHLNKGVLIHFKTEKEHSHEADVTGMERAKCNSFNSSLKATVQPSKTFDFLHVAEYVVNDNTILK